MASLARDLARSMGSGYPKGLGAKPQEAGSWGGGRGRGAKRWPHPLAWSPPPRLCQTPSSARIPLLPGKACLPLPSYDAPCCIATRIRVPSRLPGRATLDPSPVVLAGPRGSALAPPAVAAFTPPASAPEPRSALTLTGLRSLLSFTCVFAKTCHQTRASIPGRWFIVCARARRDVPWCRPLPPGPNPVPCAHALHPLNFCFLPFPQGEGWDRKF